jgi:Na+(H+)/acetate symporter ActP
MQGLLMVASYASDMDLCQLGYSQCVEPEKTMTVGKVTLSNYSLVAALAGLMNSGFVTLFNTWG